MNSDQARSASARVLLVGVGPTAGDAFAALLPRFKLVAFIRPEQDDVTRDATRAGVPIVVETSMDALESAILEHIPDVVVVSSYHRIIPSRILEQVPFVNVHYAPLPAYRGRATVNWAIINGETETAITIHRMGSVLDAGGILRQVPVPIGPTDTVADLYERLNRLQRELLAGAVEDCLSGAAGIEQDKDAATYTCTRVPADGEIDWSAPTTVIDRLVRALTAPYPSAFTYLGLQRVWISRAAPSPEPPTYVGRVPGRVVQVDREAGWVDVLTGDSVYRIFELRADGDTTPRPANAIVKSLKDTLGLRPAALLDRLTTLERQLGEQPPGRD